MIKRLWCKHNYQLLTTYEKDIDKSVGYNLQNMYVMYCPKCRKEIEVLEWKYNNILAKQKADEDYARLKQEEYNRKYRE